MGKSVAHRLCFKRRRTRWNIVDVETRWWKKGYSSHMTSEVDWTEERGFIKMGKSVAHRFCFKRRRTCGNIDVETRWWNGRVTLVTGLRWVRSEKIDQLFWFWE
ncbi:hypothetical protein CEXT_233711 [Caerostris extrusa]|uniref:Uncharacterized protein n=1 Tax=Caerostris extrusa TaxID=172846 RepID=A0AAV4VWN1_CAEEX|nr:hypothetical protein CEXT_233711 [Caerostris extrusa]